MSPDPDHIDQVVELLVSLQPEPSTLEPLISKWLRDNCTRQQLAAVSLLRHWADELAKQTEVALQLIRQKLHGSDPDTVQHGIQLVKALHPKALQQLWRWLLPNPTCIRMGRGAYRLSSSRYGEMIFEEISALLPDEALLGIQELQYRAVYRSVDRVPSSLLRMRNLHTLDFTDGFPGHRASNFPRWLPALSSVKHLYHTGLKFKTLTSAMLPPALHSLRITHSSIEQVSLNQPTLASLALVRCRNLHSLDLNGCNALEILDLPGCQSLMQLPQSIVTLPSLQRLDISDCRRLDVPVLHHSRPEVAILSRGGPRFSEPARRPLSTRRSLRDNIRSGRPREVMDVIKQLPALDEQLRQEAKRHLQRTLCDWLLHRETDWAADAEAALVELNDPTMISRLWAMIASRPASVGSAKAAKLLRANITLLRALMHLGALGPRVHETQQIPLLTSPTREGEGQRRTELRER